MGWRRERAVGVHEGAREGWLGAVGRPAEGWGTEVGRVWGGLRRRGAAWALWMREHSPPPREAEAVV